MTIKNLFTEFTASIKSPDTEEKIDLVFYRLFGFFIAKGAYVLKLTPTHLTLLGLLSGVTAACLYLNDYFFLPTFLYLLSGIFDSSDGQLARIANQSSKIGLILDGVCDSLVTISIYAAGIYPWFVDKGWWAWPIGYLGAALHSNQCAALDFYHREYLYFGYGKISDDTYWNPEVSEAQNNARTALTASERFFNTLRISWIKQQRLTSSRPAKWRYLMREFLHNSSPEEKEKFCLRYRQLNKPLLPFWRLIGVNMHTIVIVTAFYFNFFPTYIILFDFILFNLVILIMRKIQYHADDQLIKEFFNEKA